ncbi:hypothetical protein D6777_02980, partial [Candidatus Woesearchaeota archaeon]
MKKKIFGLIVLALLLRLVLLFLVDNVWWDGAVYISMGKYIFSLGKLGLWEHIRPLVLPLILGLFWKIGLSPLFWGKLFEIGCSMIIIYLTYKITKRDYNEKSALYAATILAFTPVFFSFAFRIYTEIPSTMFALLALNYRQKIKTGVFSALAFLTKFPQGIVLVVVSAFNIKKIKKIILGFSLTVLPYLLFNYLYYTNPLKPFIDGKEIIKHAGIWIFAKPWWFYFVESLRQNVLYIFAVAGLLALKGKRKDVAALLMLFFAYFSLLQHKEPRFMIIFLPYLAIMAGVGLDKLFKRKNIFFFVLLISLIILAVNFSGFDDMYKGREQFFNYLDGKQVNGPILVSHPYIALHANNVSLPMYFMVYDENLAQYWIDYIKQNSSNVSYIFFDTCEGGTICPENDEK